MSSRRPSLLGLLLAVGLTAAIAALSRVPYEPDAADRALVRLSWRYQPEGDQGCRRPTPEELADLPPHMRNPNACVRTPTPYGLRLILDGEMVVDDTIRAAGARQDRPIFVYLDAPISMGLHAIEVDFAALAPEASRPGADEPSGIALSWADTVNVQSREIVMIGYDRPTRRLIRVTAAAARTDDDPSIPE